MIFRQKINFQNRFLFHSFQHMTEYARLTFANAVLIPERDYHVPFFSLRANRAIVKLIPADRSKSRPDSMALPHLLSHRKAGVIGIARESVTEL